MTEQAAPAPAAGATEPAAPVAVAPEGQTALGAGKETKVQDAPVGDKAPVGAPEKYEDFKLPEGVEVNKSAMEQFVPLAKELNLSQEQAQKLVDIQSAYVQAMAKEQETAWAGIQEGWVKAAKADKEIGGVAFNDQVALASKAIQQFGTAELRAAMDATGVGNHPEFIRVFARIGKAISEDKVHISNADSPPAPLSWAERIFPNQGKQ